MVLPAFASLERLRITPKRESKLLSCLKYVYDKDKKEFFRRNAVSWGKILAYYSVFLGFIFGIFAAILYVILHYINMGDYPLYAKHSFRLSDVTFVDLSVFPMVNHDPMIDVNTMSNSHYLKYANNIQDILKKYKSDAFTRCGVIRNKRFSLPSRNEMMSHKVKRDTYSHFRFAKKMPCSFNVSSLGPCSVFPYGYDIGKPCIYLKINKALQRSPIPYLNNSTLPGSMPEEVKAFIRNSTVPKIWVHCKGENRLHKKLLGHILYHPDQSFDMRYFPYTRNVEYQSPLIAMQLNNIRKANVEITLTCALWLDDDTNADVTFKINMITSQKKIFTNQFPSDLDYYDYEMP